MGLFANPLAHAGYPPTGKPFNRNSSVRAATLTESNAGTLDNVYITPATAQASTVLDFANPPVGGFGSTTPRPVFATTLNSLGATTLNTSGAATTTIGTGGTGIVAIGNATGNTAVTGSLTTTTTLTGGTGITATTGNITATNGNIVRGTAGNKDVYTSVATTTAAGANSAGTVTLVGGTATIATTAVTASSKIRMSRQGIGATGAFDLGVLTVGTIVAGVSFDINAVDIVESTLLQETDVSIIFWEIVN